MIKLEERLHLARIVLSQLDRAGPIGWTELERRTLKRCGTPRTFKSIMLFLKSKGCIKKAGPKYREPYTITERGKLFLEGFLEEESHEPHKKHFRLSGNDQ